MFTVIVEWDRGNSRVGKKEILKYKSYDLAVADCEKIIDNGYRDSGCDDYFIPAHRIYCVYIKEES